jgi:hypothetical protein
MPLSLAASGNADHAEVLPAGVCVAIRSARTWLMGTTKLGARPMAITGRVRLRKTMTGRVLVQIEDTRNPCPWSSRQRVCWRDAKVMDLFAPALRPLIDLTGRSRFLPIVSSGQGMANDASAVPAPLAAEPPQAEPPRITH